MNYKFIYSYSYYVPQIPGQQYSKLYNRFKTVVTIVYTEWLESTAYYNIWMNTKFVLTL